MVGRSIFGAVHCRPDEEPEELDEELLDDELELDELLPSVAPQPAKTKLAAMSEPFTKYFRFILGSVGLRPM